MPLISCPICGHHVSKKATACPRCAEPDPSRKKRNGRILSQLLGLIILLAAGGCFYFLVMPQHSGNPLIPAILKR